MKVTLIKIAGILCLVIGSIIGLGMLIGIPDAISDLSRRYRNSFDIAFFIGNIIGFLIVALIPYLLIKYGLKWSSYKKSSKKIDEIDEIGKGY